MASKTTDTCTRSTILRQAAKLFAQRGYDAVSVREIVEAAGCTKPSLYYHFGSKEGLAQALIGEFTKAAVAARNQVFEEAEDAEDAFVRFGREMLKLAVQFKDTLAFGFSIWFGRSSLKSLVSHVEETDKQAYAAWADALVRLGLAPTLAMPAVRSFWAMLMHELMQVVACPRWEGDAEELSETIAAVVMHGVLNLHTVRKR
ncbi:MAG: TetR/AcrR family transcriptional regulator [Planctomycetes bacterium]|nr:TetR/AcrR family transcriptional regulator [Planctomycetota bacterium]